MSTSLTNLLRCVIFFYNSILCDLPVTFLDGPNSRTDGLIDGSSAMRNSLTASTVHHVFTYYAKFNVHTAWNKETSVPKRSFISATKQ